MTYHNFPIRDGDLASDFPPNFIKANILKHHSCLIISSMFSAPFSSILQSISTNKGNNFFSGTPHLYRFQSDNLRILMDFLLLTQDQKENLKEKIF